MQTRKGKWQPFDALEGYKDALRNVEYKMGKIEMPELSESDIEIIMECIYKAIEKKKLVDVSYYLDGYIYKCEGYAQRFDLQNSTFILTTKKIMMKNIIQVNICE